MIVEVLESKSGCWFLQTRVEVQLGGTVTV